MPSRLTILFLIGLLLAAGVGTAFLLGGGERTPGPVSHAAPAHEDPAAPAGGEEEGPPPGDASISTEAFDPEDEESWDEAGTAAALPRLVKVVDQEGRPVDRALVEVVRPSGRFRRILEEERRSEPLARKRTDERGLAAFQTRRFRGRRVGIRATKGDLLGYVQVNRDDPMASEEENILAVVTLQPKRRVEIHVIDTAGLPGGNVRLDLRPAGSAAGRGRRRFGPTLSVWTSKDKGVAEVEVSAEDTALYEAERYRVTARLFGLDPVTVEEPASETPLTLIEVTVPPFVTADVRIKKKDGSLYRPEVLLTWRNTTGDEALDQRARIAALLRSGGRRRVVGGRVRIGGFAPGGDVLFQLDPEERIATSLEMRLPSSPGVVPVDLEIGEIRPFVTFGLDEAEGTPLAGRRVRVRVVTETEENEDPEARMLSRIQRRFRGERHIQTDRDGVIRIPVQPGVAGKIEVRPRERRRRGGRGRGRSRMGNDDPPMAVISFKAITPGEEVDLGRVIVDRGPLLVGGVVVDERGRPQPLAIIEVTGRPKSTENARGRRRPRPIQHMEVCDEEGRFRLFATARAELIYEIAAAAGTVKAPAVPFEPGTQDLRLVARRTGSLAGRIRLAHPELGPGLTLTLSRRFPDGSPSIVGLNVETDDDGRILVKNLAEGDYVLRIRAGPMETLITEGLHVEPGETTRPAAIADLVVGQDLFPAAVQVRDEAGAPIPGARIQAIHEVERLSPWGGRSGGRTDAEGELTMVLLGGVPLRVEVQARGFQPLTLRNPTFPLVVTLKRALDVTVALDLALPDREGLEGYRLILSRVDDPPPAGQPRDPIMGRRFSRGRRASRNMAAGDTEARFLNLQAGTYDVRLEIRTTAESSLGRRRASILLGRIQVSAGNTRPAPLPVDLQALENVLQEAPPRNRSSR